MYINSQKRKVEIEIIEFVSQNKTMNYSIPKPLSVEPKISLNLLPQSSKIRAFSRRNESSQSLQVTKKGQKAPRRLISISTSDGRWHGKWNLDYTFSLHDLQLQDLTADLQNDRSNEVSVTLSIQKHTGFGLSVDGKIITSFTRKCCNCSSPFCREIDTNFNVLVLPTRKQKKSSDNQLPEIGGDDPSVIYVKPGDEVNFDSLIKDTIRLATAVNVTCSETCEKSEPVLQCKDTKEKSVDLVYNIYVFSAVGPFFFFPLFLFY